MGILLLNSDHEIRSTLQERNTDVVTLLIPESTLFRYDQKEHRNLPKRIPIVPERYQKRECALKA